MDKQTEKQLKQIACKVRMGILEGIHAAKAGHPGGSLSCTDILTYLYFNKMNIDPKDPQKPMRSRGAFHSVAQRDLPCSARRVGCGA